MFVMFVEGFQGVFNSLDLVLFIDLKAHLKQEFNDKETPEKKDHEKDGKPVKVLINKIFDPGSEFPEKGSHCKKP
jgi:hypothetical protein